jgi:hypothetical protein
VSVGTVPVSVGTVVVSVGWVSDGAVNVVSVLAVLVRPLVVDVGVVDPFVLVVPFMLVVPFVLVVFEGVVVTLGVEFGGDRKACSAPPSTPRSPR